eukprot:CAMPEP_0201632176 /NCGR_PEP_ID=MMETSP0493-20130528/5900_1 /ASSEMBLY_ACC=CAM_ASM_000838 /TAXON_ID=420259 /ORGANISM="Thalassiosira gravida, Strain GMp14c1" /LENGTH=341 /DNA_ID=CAMNT_0048103641 /DNA_START=865 /DNA_END=1887 /DNA_ORIENTATION=+
MQTVYKLSHFCLHWCYYSFNNSIPFAHVHVNNPSQGYCHRHSHVRLAKKKLTGGWKILRDFCVECAEDDDQRQHDDNRSDCSRSSRKSAASRSSRKSARTQTKRSSNMDEMDSVSTSQSEQNQKKLVKKMKYTDDDGDEGLYTGYVNSQYKPHGSGKMLYDNGNRFSGQWCEGTKVHGNTTMCHNGKFKRNQDKKIGKMKNNVTNVEPSFVASANSNNGTIGGGNGSVEASATRTFGSGGNVNVKSTVPRTVVSGSVRALTPTSPKQHAEMNNETKQKPNKQAALRDYKALYNTAHVVKNMMFIDLYGDRGRYTGEVNDQKIPHGLGVMTYDHGLMQEGNW